MPSSASESTPLAELLERWRQRLAQEEAIGPDQLDELQDHLEAEMQSPCLGDLSKEERAIVAAHRVGHAEALGRDYFDADPGAVWGPRMLWVAGGGLAMSGVFHLLSAGQVLWVSAVEGTNVPVFMALNFALSLALICLVMAWILTLVEHPAVVARRPNLRRAASIVMGGLAVYAGMAVVVVGPINATPFVVLDDLNWFGSSWTRWHQLGLAVLLIGGLGATMWTLHRRLVRT